MKRLLALAMTLLLLLMATTACGSSASSGANNGAAADAYTTESATDGGYKESVSTSTGLQSTVDPGAANTALANAKIIYTGDLTLQTTDLEAAANAIFELVNGFEGYMESQEVYLNRSYKEAYYTVRVPGGRFDEFLNSVSESELCTVTYRNVTSENVGEAYADIENRLETLNIKLDRLQSLLVKAENMEDIITIESEITEVEYEIEALSGQKNRYDSLINYSTVHITLVQVTVASEGVDPTLGERLSISFKRGIENFLEGCQDFLVWLVGNWISLLVFVVIVVAVITFLRKAKLKGPRRKRKPRKEEPKAEE